MPFFSLRYGWLPNTTYRQLSYSHCTTYTDPIVTHASLDLEEEVSKNLAACHSTVHQIINSCEFPARIHIILKENQKLMYNYLVLFRSKFGLKKLLLSVLNKISRNEIVSLKLCKKVALALANFNLIPQDWLEKTVLEVPVNLSNKGAMLSILINETTATCILDIGSF